MASTYSPYLQIQLIGTGDQSNTWGTTTNVNFNLFEQAIAGTAAVLVTAPNQALTVINGATDQARMASLILTTTVGANFNVYAPPSPKLYTVFNNSNFVATIYNATVANGTTAAGTGIAIPANSTAALFSDGTNFYYQSNNISLFTQGTLAVSQGGSGATSTTGSGNNVLSNSPTLTGVPLAPTATVGTNNTQLATTAFVVTAVTNATGSLGTMSTQNANAVAITGGTISGVTLSSVVGLGSMASQNSNAVSITGGTLSGVGVSATSVSTANASITGGTITGTTVNSNVVGSNSVGARTVSSAAPSGGASGDIWYQV